MGDLFHVGALKRHGDLQEKRKSAMAAQLRNMTGFWRSKGRDHRQACSEKQPI
jgi:hypothetical protein